jgi:hypothetical protein
MRVIQFSEKDFDKLTAVTREALELSTLRLKEKYPDSKHVFDELYRAYNYHLVSLMNMLRSS